MLILPFLPLRCSFRFYMPPPVCLSPFGSRTFRTTHSFAPHLPACHTPPTPPHAFAFTCRFWIPSHAALFPCIHLDYCAHLHAHRRCLRVLSFMRSAVRLRFGARLLVTAPGYARFYCTTLHSHISFLPSYTAAAVLLPFLTLRLQFTPPPVYHASTRLCIAGSHTRTYTFICLVLVPCYLLPTLVIFAGSRRTVPDLPLFTHTTAAFFCGYLYPTRYRCDLLRWVFVTRYTHVAVRCLPVRRLPLFGLRYVFPCLPTGRCVTRYAFAIPPFLHIAFVWWTFPTIYRYTFTPHLVTFSYYALLRFAARILLLLLFPTLLFCRFLFISITLLPVGTVVVTSLIRS